MSATTVGHIRGHPHRVSWPAPVSRRNAVISALVRPARRHAVRQKRVLVRTDRTDSCDIHRHRHRIITAMQRLMCADTMAAEVRAAAEAVVVEVMEEVAVVRIVVIAAIRPATIKAIVISSGVRAKTPIRVPIPTVAVWIWRPVTRAMTRNHASDAAPAAVPAIRTEVPASVRHRRICPTLRNMCKRRHHPN